MRFSIIYVVSGGFIVASFLSVTDRRQEQFFLFYNPVVYVQLTQTVILFNSGCLYRSLRQTKHVGNVVNNVLKNLVVEVMQQLNRNHSYVFYLLHISCGNSTDSVIFCSSSGTHALDHLAADGACFTGGQVAVVTVGQVDANFP